MKPCHTDKSIHWSMVSCCTMMKGRRPKTFCANNKSYFLECGPHHVFLFVSFCIRPGVVETPLLYIPCHHSNCFMHWSMVSCHHRNSSTHMVFCYRSNSSIHRSVISSVLHMSMVDLLLLSVASKGGQGLCRCLGSETHIASRQGWLDYWQAVGKVFNLDVQHE